MKAQTTGALSHQANVHVRYSRLLWLGVMEKWEKAKTEEVSITNLWSFHPCTGNLDSTFLKLQLCYIPGKRRQVTRHLFLFYKYKQRWKCTFTTFRFMLFVWVLQWHYEYQFYLWYTLQISLKFFKCLKIWQLILVLYLFFTTITQLKHVLRPDIFDTWH